MTDPAPEAEGLLSRPVRLEAEAAGAPLSAPAGRALRAAPLIVSCALFMQNLDSTVLSTALPSMAASLHQDPLRLNLAMTAYLLSAAVFLPLTAWAADRFGARAVFATAVAIFTAASVLCGASRTLPELVVARILQGFGGAMMVPVGRLVVLRTTPRRELVRAMTLLTLPAMLGPLLGPPVGGLVVTYGSWRWIFFLNLPVGLLGVTMALALIPDIREEERPPLDLGGFLLSASALACIVYGLESAGRSRLPPAFLAAVIAVGLGLGAGYVRHSRHQRTPMLDLGLLRIPTFRASVVGGGMARLTMGSTPFLLAMLLQVGFGFPALLAGLTTCASAAGAMVMRASALPIIRRLGFKRVLILNSLVVAALLASYALFRPMTPYLVMAGVLFVSGVARSLQILTLNTLAYAEVPAARMSRASSLSSVGQQLSQSFGIAGAALLVHLSLAARHGRQILPDDVRPALVAMALVSLLGLGLFFRLPDDVGEEMRGLPRVGRLADQG